MFQTWKYYSFLLIMCIFTLVSLIFFPGVFAFVVFVCFVGVSGALILRAIFGMALSARQQHQNLVALIREHNAAYNVKFDENEARVRQLGGLVREAERAVAGFGEVQRVKFDENEARVRQLGGLVREAERAVAGFGEVQRVKFDENEARVRQLGGLVREAERAVAGFGEVQRVKFDENEARVRQLGGLIREAERAVARLGEETKTLRNHFSSDDVKRRATVELKLRILNDLTVLRELLEKRDTDSSVRHEPVWTPE
ncbi:hypothetical protein OL239_07005 [Arthrobacter sp. ATA002]|uniref:hypothetical protein n=1 Tax=Arthrobacter sp. ATA002 TaxID=2991715 RepID=UPI0022A66B0E|nr:hypothetical protein [Arthrobacter sp. ATA002]WAP52884.1 hypothetical protein OL239_07005 [Arthrobacter sp. ATA002]